MKTKCIQCKQEYKIYQYEIKRGRKFCSNQCKLQFQTPIINNIFKNWNSISAYILGLIWADGNIYTQKNKSTILDITSIDECIIRQIHNIMGNNTKVYEAQPKIGNANKIFSTKTRDKNIINSLIKEGITENKTYNLVWPKTLPANLNSHFIRGFFDGDGCVFKNQVSGYQYLHCSFTSIKTDFFNKLFETLQPYNPKWYIDKRHKADQIRIYSKQAVKDFANFIYQEEKICLQRKKKIFIENKYLNL